MRFSSPITMCYILGTDGVVLNYTVALSVFHVSSYRRRETCYAPQSRSRPRELREQREREMKGEIGKVIGLRVEVVAGREAGGAGTGGRAVGTNRSENRLPGVRPGN